jgi:hypothetical protein
VSSPFAIVAAGHAATYALRAAADAPPSTGRLCLIATEGDPVALGLVSSPNWPGGNQTGVSFLGPLMEPKRLGLLHEVVPQTKTGASS